MHTHLDEVFPVGFERLRRRHAQQLCAVYDQAAWRERAAGVNRDRCWGVDCGCQRPELRRRRGTHSYVTESR